MLRKTRTCGRDGGRDLRWMMRVIVDDANVERVAGIDALEATFDTAKRRESLGERRKFAAQCETVPMAAMAFRTL